MQINRHLYRIYSLLHADDFFGVLFIRIINFFMLFEFGITILYHAPYTN